MHATTSLRASARERVRLTDDYLIRVLPVPPPQVHITWPGRDYSASSIEEVTTDVQASDDYGLQSLELRYSVNGGAWRTVALHGAKAPDQQRPARFRARVVAARRRARARSAPAI